MQRCTAQEFVNAVVDLGSFTPLPVAGTSTDDAAYAAELQHARERTGLNEAVLTGTATVGGHDALLVISEFGFLGGSVGVATSDAILSAMEHATAHRLPLLVAPASGGTRMQEGTPAFVQMLKLGAAVRAHRRAGLPYLAHLRHPTTGGVLASWASLGHFTTAEPGALVGFLGPRAQEALIGERIPGSVQRAENLAGMGVIDAVVATGDVAAVWARALDTLRSAPIAAPAPTPGRAPTERDAWEAVLSSRRPDRPGVLDVVAECADGATWLSGTGDGGIDPAMKAGLATLSGQPCVVVGTCRDAQLQHRMGAAGLRIAQRAFTLAEELRLPVVTLIDTPGADLSADAENHGISGEIARTLGALSDLSVPTVSVILGQGAGGAALALLAADRVVCAERGWLAPLAPEGASAILHRTGDRAPEMAARHRIGAMDLQRSGLVDDVLAEPGRWTPASVRDFCTCVGGLIARHLAELREQPVDERVEARLQRFRSLSAAGRGSSRP